MQLSSIPTAERPFVTYEDEAQVSRLAQLSDVRNGACELVGGVVEDVSAQPRHHQRGMGNRCVDHGPSTLLHTHLEEAVSHFSLPSAYDIRNLLI
jgi:hypothetical protein